MDDDAGPVPVRTGVCVVRAEEWEGAVRVRITVTGRLDIHDLATEETWCSTSIPAAVAHVWEFLSAFEGAAR